MSPGRGTGGVREPSLHQLRLFLVLAEEPLVDAVALATVVLDMPRHVHVPGDDAGVLPALCADAGAAPGAAEPTTSAAPAA